MMRTLAMAMLGGALVGCASAPPPTWAETAAAADEASLSLAAQMALLVVPGNIDADETPEQTAAAAAAGAEAAFDPIGCASATVEGTHVTYVLDECTGSFGLVHVSGTMDVTFVDGDVRVSVFHASASDLVLRGARVSFEADASVVRVVNVRTIEATTHAHGTTASGRAFSREGSVTARWMDSWGCLFVDTATQSTDLLGREGSLGVSALSYCVGECPMAGGQLTFSAPGADAPMLELEYAGSPDVAWSAVESEESGALTIVCGV